MSQAFSHDAWNSIEYDINMLKCRLLQFCAKTETDFMDLILALNVGAHVNVGKYF